MEEMDNVQTLPHISLDDNKDYIWNVFKGPKKEMDILSSTSLASLKNSINHLGIQKNDIVDIIRNEGEWFLLYYKEKE